MSWDALNTAVAEARALVAAGAPDSATAAEGEAYVARIVAAGLSGAFLGHLLHEDGLARPLPVHGGPNPDYIMRHAVIDPASRYRLIGQMNGSERLGIGLYKPDAAGGPPIEVGYAMLTPRDCDEDGCFALDLTQQGSGPGVLKLCPEARILLVRILHRDSENPPARLRLVGGASSSGLSLMTGSNDGALAYAARTLVTNVKEYMRWTDAVQAHPNRFASPPPDLAQAVQGDPDTQYFLGSYDLAQGEQLHVTMPTDIIGYWSIHAYDYWFQHLQTPGVGDRNAKAGVDGHFSIVIAPEVAPDLPNAIDTLGRRKGALICRVIGARKIKAPEARVVARADE